MGSPKLKDVEWFKEDFVIFAFCMGLDNFECIKGLHYKRMMMGWSLVK